ncbi:MAG: hypothetical protein LBH44_10760 [Treponema sp.]|jgi:hypothetical protein|nr:hypothetical protein [Treponema sp.]
MNYSIYVILHFETKKEHTKIKLMNKVKKIIEEEYKINQIEGNIIIVELENISTWEYCVYKIIDFAQDFGYQWIITGSINFEISLWSNDSKISGIKAMEINCSNNYECANFT